IPYYTIDPDAQNDGLRYWDIPATLPEGLDYKIKITSSGSDNVLDFSDANFTLSYNITVTSPNGGESWQSGTTPQITWTDNISGLVKIELYKAGVFNYLIKDMTDSDGSYGWDIPFDFLEGSDYKVLITSIDDPSLFDYSDDNFTIILVPEITVIYPNGGENWQTGTTKTITWSDNLAENVRIRLYFFGNFITLENSVPSSGSYVWEIPLDFPQHDFYKVWINSVNDTTIEDYSDAEFSIATTAINIASPNGGESWQAGTTHAITSTDNISDDVKIDLYKGGTFHSSIKDTAASDGTYNWNIAYNISGGSDYKVKMTSLGNPDVFDFSDNNFTIIGNQVTVTSPNGGENWQVGTDHPITWADNFSDNVKIQLFKSDIFYATLRPNTPSDSLWNWNNIADTIPPGSDYKVKISSRGDSSVFDFSDNNFTIVGNQITVTSPNGGENWLLNTRETITWTDNFSANVKIELYKGGTFHSVIVNSTTGDGVKNWDIPAFLPEGSDYKIKITRLDIDNVFDFSDSVFSLKNEIAVIFPNGSESLQKGSTQTITWFDNLSSAIKIELYKSETFYSEISASTPNDGSKPWDIPLDLPNGTDYKIKITSIDIPDFFDFSDAEFTINSNDTSVEFISNDIPDEYILFQNYPNPFNPSTKIEFGLVEQSSVSLKLYDIM
ncbi:MAG: Ser-Thr-rich GPI-anchored membrane family protein, partial [Ignavibacteriaceae bacterium]